MGKDGPQAEKKPTTVAHLMHRACPARGMATSSPWPQAQQAELAVAPV
jgi:hypothetical protein